MHPSLKRTSLALLCLLSLLLLSGCPYEAAFPLGSPDGAAIDTRLIGKWRIENETEEKGSVLIRDFNGHELIILIEESGSSKRDMMRAFTTRIGADNFLNLQELRDSGARTWMFAQYTVEGCRLSYRIIDDALLKEHPEAARDSKAFSRFVAEHAGEDRLYGSPAETLVCVKKQ